MRAALKRIVIGLYTASQWHSDQSGNGLATLQLSSTRKVHSEEHRSELIREIHNNLIYCYKVMKNDTDITRPVSDFEPNKEIIRLSSLLGLIADAKIGKEWISDSDNMRLNEILFRANEL